MNPEIKEQWIAALKSGNYRKDTGSLKTKEGYCCLGVLCEIYHQTHTDSSIWEPIGGHMLQFTLFDGEFHPHVSRTGYLPEPVATWAGIADHDCDTINQDDTQGRLARLNDRSITFYPIIEVIANEL